MLSNNTACFMSVPNPENKRMLVGGKTQPNAANVSGKNVFTIRFTEPVNMKAGADVTILADMRGKFHQQAGSLMRIEESGDQPLLLVQMTGEPVNCEARNCYRVSVAAQNINMTIDKQPNCTLADISSEGLAAITSQPLTVGTSVDVDLSVEGIYARGALRVQTEKKLPNGKIRYGLLAPERKSPIRKSLEALSSLMQRRQLQRMARAA
jgi:hypothetical protein